MTKFPLTKLHIRFEWDDQGHKDSASVRTENTTHGVKHGDWFVTTIQQVQTADDVIGNAPIVPAVHLQHSSRDNQF